jgi:hypothetical protein
MDIAEVTPRQLALYVGNPGAGVINSTTSSSPSNSSTIVGGKIRCGSIDFLP